MFQAQLGLCLQHSFQLFSSNLCKKQKPFMKLQQQFINSHMINSGRAGYKKIQQRCRHREYYCLLGAKRGLRNVSQHGSFLQIGTLLHRQGHGASPCWASQCLRWCWGWHGMWGKEENSHPMGTGCKSLWPHKEPQCAYQTSLSYPGPRFIPTWFT